MSKVLKCKQHLFSINLHGHGRWCTVALPQTPVLGTVIFKTNIDPGVNNFEINKYIVRYPQVGQYVM
jgi:hypothetical protein